MSNIYTSADQLIGKTPLLELTIYAGSRDSANDIMKRFCDNTDSIYEKIVDIMTGSGEKK